MPDRFATHEVFNQSPAFENVNLFACDRALGEAVVREGGKNGIGQLERLGGVCGSAASFKHGRMANEFTPRLRPFDSKGHRLDLVEYHPSYDACMEMSIGQGLHCSAWDHQIGRASCRERV